MMHGQKTSKIMRYLAE